MSRARTGLTGLAILFLLVLSAAALFAPRPLTGAGPAMVEDPLATLGVAPGNPEPAEPPRSRAPRLESQPIPTRPDGFDLDDFDGLDAIPRPGEDGIEDIDDGELTEI